MPVILSMCFLMITIVFYFHDKNVVMGTAYEEVAKGCCEEINEEEIEKQFREKLRNRLLMFSTISIDIYVEKTKLVMECFAYKNGMTFHIQAVMSRTTPEKNIRSVRRIEKIKEQIGEGIDEGLLQE